MGSGVRDMLSTPLNRCGACEAKNTGKMMRCGKYVFDILIALHSHLSCLLQVQSRSICKALSLPKACYLTLSLSNSATLPIRNWLGARIKPTASPQLGEVPLPAKSLWSASLMFCPTALCSQNSELIVYMLTKVLRYKLLSLFCAVLQ